MKEISTGNSLPPLHIVNVLWGKETRELYFDKILPSQLTKGNFGALRDLNATYILFTTKEDQIAILKNDRYCELQDFLPVRIHIIPPVLDQNKYLIMSNCHRLAVENGQKEQAAIFFLAPDALLSEGSISYLLQSLQTGKRLILTSSLRSNRKNFFSHLDMSKREIAPRELVKAVLATIHPFAGRQFWGNRTISAWPSHLYWKIDSQNLLARCFHLHPLVVWPEKWAAISSTIDFDFYILACPDKTKWEIIDDSDKVFVTDITADRFPLFNLEETSIARLGFWAFQATTKEHREFAQTPIWIHSEEKSAAWKPLELLSGSIIESILKQAHPRSFFSSPKWIGWWLLSKYANYKSRISWKWKSLKRLLLQ